MRVFIDAKNPNPASVSESVRSELNAEIEAFTRQMNHTAASFAA